MLTEQKIIDKIEITVNETISVRECTTILKDGVEVAKSFYRYTLPPGSDVSDQPQRIRRLAETLWTTEVVLAYNESIEKNIIG